MRLHRSLMKFLISLMESLLTKAHRKIRGIDVTINTSVYFALYDNLNNILDYNRKEGCAYEAT
jgi:hypothetical protein